MSEWRVKRFWSEVAASPVEGGLTITLDGRPVRTPAKAALILPTRALAEAIAAEWREVEEEVRPDEMPLCRAANSAIDKVAPAHGAVVAALAAYGESDLLCYRAEGPAGLIAAEAAAWDPWLTWAETALDAPLTPGSGILPVAQPRSSIERLSARLVQMESFKLTAVHDLVTLSGSLVLGLAVADRALDAAEAWSASRVDEEYQAEQWGRDADAEAAADARRRAFLAAARLLDLLDAD